jgi:hypothetical protein
MNSFQQSYQQFSTPRFSLCLAISLSFQQSYQQFSTPLLLLLNIYIRLEENQPISESSSRPQTQSPKSCSFPQVQTLMIYPKIW